MHFKHFTRLFLLIGMIGMFSASVLAQGGGELVEIGTATTGTTLSPIYTPKNYSFTQQLYTAEEIGTDGTITSIAFHWAFNGSKTFGIDVYMKHTERAYFETSADRIPLSASDKVFTGTINPDQDSWITITLDEPFEYDGSSNLVIAVHRTSGSPGFNDLNNWNVIPTWYCTSTDRYTMLYMGDDQSQYVSLSPAYMTPSNNRPNIQIEIGSSTTTCKAPKNLAVSDITTNSATLSWTAGSGDQTDWDVYYTTSSVAPDENTTPSFQVTECTKVLTGLTAQTTYYAYVRASCSSADKSRWISTNFTTTREALHVGSGNPYQTDFESTCDWAFTNGTLTNQWCWGSATNNGGQKAMYISNDNGTNNAYSANSAAVVFASKLFSFDPGTYTFVYDWKANGESTYDYLRVALVPGDMEFTAGPSLPSGVGTTTLPNGWIALDGGEKLNLANSWQNQALEATVSGTYTMVFLWRDDTSGGSQPPAAIDNISISMTTCSRPTSLIVDATTLTWTPGNEGQDAWEISLSTTTNPEDGTIIPVTGTPSYTFTNLALETQYYAFVRSDCGTDGKSSWSEAASLYLGYCQPAPTSVDKQGITNVTFGTGNEIVNNDQRPESKPYYGNYSSQIGAALAGSEVDVAITYQTGYTYGTLIWVDWNNDFMFEDSEIVYTGMSTNANPTTLNASFTIAQTQSAGYYRMRIGGADSYFDSYVNGNHNANHDPCYNSSYAVFHDYTLHVTENTSDAFAKPITAYNENGGYYLIASPVGTVNPENVTNMLENSYDLYYFDQSQELEWINYKGDQTLEQEGHFNLEPGKGYLYANSNNVTLTFTGTPYNGNGQVDLAYDANAVLKGWNLIGNPFGTMATLNKPYYRLNADGNALKTETEETPIAVMEGVFVQATGTGEKANFTTASRGERASVAKLNIMVTRDRGVVEDYAIVRFDGGATLGKFQLNPSHTKVYIPQEGKDYAIVRSATQGELPVNFKAEKNGTYTLSFSNEEVTFNYLHLIDNLTGADVDLLQQPNYTFDSRMSDYASRFRLVFAADGANEDVCEPNFAYYNGSNWTVNNQGKATLQVIDVMGRVLYSETLNGNAEININQASGVYMLRLISGDSVKVQKVVVR